MKNIFILLIFCLLNILSNTINAQPASVNATSTMTFNDAVTITATGLNQNATFSTIANYTTGITNTNAVQLVVGATKNFTITAAAASTNFTGGSSTIPATKLLVRAAGSGSYVAIGSLASPTTLFSNQPLGASSNFYVDYQFNPGFSGYVPGVYSISIVYTASLL